MIHQNGLHASLYLGFPPSISVGIGAFPLASRRYLRQLEKYKAYLEMELRRVEKVIERLKKAGGR